MERRCDETGIPCIHPNVLRHHFVHSWLLRAGGDGSPGRCCPGMPHPRWRNGPPRPPTGACRPATGSERLVPCAPADTGGLGTQSYVIGQQRSDGDRLERLSRVGHQRRRQLGDRVNAATGAFEPILRGGRFCQLDPDWRSVQTGMLPPFSTMRSPGGFQLAGTGAQKSGQSSC